MFKRCPWRCPRRPRLPNEASADDPGGVHGCASIDVECSPNSADHDCGRDGGRAACTAGSEATGGAASDGVEASGCSAFRLRPTWQKLEPSEQTCPKISKTYKHTHLMLSAPRHSLRALQRAGPRKSFLEVHKLRINAWILLDVLLVVVIDPSAVTALATVAKFQLVVTLFLRQSILEVPPQLKPVVKSKALGFVNLAAPLAVRGCTFA